MVLSMEDMEMTKIVGLTTDHPASSYGVPVLVDDQGNAYGPRDIVDGVQAWALAGDSDLADKFRAAANLQPHEIDQTVGNYDLTCSKCGKWHSDLLPCEVE
jgi:hypothetical protein